MKRRRVLVISLIVLAFAMVALAAVLMHVLRVQVVLSGDSDLKVNVGQPYHEPGAKAFLGSSSLPLRLADLEVRSSGKVDTNKLGEYRLKYSANWLFFESSSTRRVLVVDTTAPELTLKGNAEVTINAGSDFTDPGCSAVDNLDGDLSQKIKTNGQIDTLTVGDYVLNYEVKDGSGNTATAKRTVKVVPVKQVSQVNPGHKVVYLTFDDGPSRYTGALLDALAARNVHVTFFVTGSGDPALIGRAAREGHTVGIHTFSHDYKKIYASKAAYLDDLNAINSVIAAQTGSPTHIMRFPGGSSNTVSSFNPGIMTTLTRDLTNMGYYYFDWNVESGDAGRVKTSDAVFNNVIAGIQRHDVSVVLQHDSHGFSTEAVGRIVDWGISHGYTFLPLDETSPQAHQRVAN
ncbi:MAG: polysaccharide deacetylase family protein [Mobiluncus porci]|nr:polysaccharide deacetylase family protein [Mobiluncus porci]MDD7541901.1 polysaccharide deacetylase family protein [Mobiluncus porci]MDY5749371.1 polysaccharide deacetylase family protein [Mobiluncus porci]